MVQIQKFSYIPRNNSVKTIDACHSWANWSN